MQRAYILSDHQIDAHTLEPGPAQCTATALTLSIPVGASLADVDRRLIFATLDLCGGVKKRAADLLGISLKTLYNRLEEYGNQDRALALGKFGRADVAGIAGVASVVTHAGSEVTDELNDATNETVSDTVMDIAVIDSLGAAFGSALEGQRDTAIGSAGSGAPSGAAIRPAIGNGLLN